MTNNREPNRLIQEKSPYLLQHAYNPVNWMPWIPEAFEKAKREDKPIFLSIGYSTCHWCHVMERESFEDNEVAEILNQNYISIKVDREERPDIDHIYMEVCQILTGSGGWPLTIIMTPDKEPFFAGTYFPKRSKFGYTGLIDILARIHSIWEKDRGKALDSSRSIIEALSRQEMGETGEELSDDTLKRAYEILKGSFDEEYGGIGAAPKFPTPHNIMFLLRYYDITKDEGALRIAVKTLESMYRGGIYDHIGFGFSRYSTDRKWLVPHFEKMLYDNALLMYAYTEAYQITKSDLFKEIVIQTGNYILRDMTSRMGGFYSAEDADSEGEEGKFYLWDKKEIIYILGEQDGKLFCETYGVTDKGNFEGKSIPNLIENELFEKINGDKRIEAARRKLFAYREQRIRPFKDDKIITSWNGLMIAAMAFAGRALDNDSFIDAASSAADFILKNLRRQDGRLLARYREGSADHLAYLEDYSFLIWGLIELYQAVFNEKYLNEAANLADEMIRLFYDEKAKGFFLYGSDGEKLIARPMKLYDNAMPSGNSTAAMVLIKLSRLTYKIDYEDIANAMFGSFAGRVLEYPAGYTYFLSSFMLAAKESIEIVLVQGKNKKEIVEMLAVLNNEFLPNISVSLKKDGEDNYSMLDGKATAYVCKGNSCSKPVNDIDEFCKLILSKLYA